uniref:polynucleotide adenylyltransferase n=1 Tax=Globodera rostochiensis TaxID=31243 RepID=A0A914HUM5_GLORO
MSLKTLRSLGEGGKNAVSNRKDPNPNGMPGHPTTVTGIRPASTLLLNEWHFRHKMFRRIVPSLCTAQGQKMPGHPTTVTGIRPASTLLLNEWHFRHKMFRRIVPSLCTAQGQKMPGRALLKMAKCRVIHLIVLLINSLTAYEIGLTLNEMDNIYSKLLNLPPADGSLSTSKLCKLWKFWHELGETFVNFHLLANEFELVIKKRINPDVNAVECSQMENIGPIFVRPLQMEIFERDIKLAHFSAIMFLMHPQKESELRIRIGGLTKPGNFVGDFSQFFGTERLKFETNFAHRLRVWHITGNVEKIAGVKIMTATLFDADILERIEFHQPMTMALEHVDDGRLAVEYAKMLFSDNLDKYELKLSARMLFGRIWAIFTKVHSLEQTKKAQNKKQGKNLAKIEQLWNEQVNALMEYFINVDNGKLGQIYEFWHKLAILNNKIWKNEAFELVQMKQIGNLQQIMHQILLIIRVELIDEHCETMARLFESENAFSECLKKSRIDGTGTRQQLLAFLASKLDVDGQSLGWNAFLSFQNIGKLLRINLTAEEVNQLQIRNYVKFLNFDTDETESKKTHLLLDLLAFYQWMKNRLGTLSAKSANFLKQNFELMELWMDAVGALKDGKEADKQREAYNILTQKVAQIYFRGDKLWQNDDGKTENGTKKWENTLNKLHLDILDTLLIDRQEFGERLGDIYLNSKRMAQMISSDSKVFVNLLKKSRNTPNFQQNNGEEQQKKRGEAPEEEINEEDVDIHLLMVSYKNLLLLERTCNAMAKKRMTVDSALFVHKTELRRLLNLVEAARADFFARPTATEEKLRSICLIKAFSDRIVRNGTLNESPQWRAELNKIIGIFYLFKNDETSDRKLLNSADCEHPQFVNAILAELNKSPMVEMIHIFMIVLLTQSMRDFAEFVVRNAYSLPKTRFYTHIDDSERIHFYNLILATDDPNQALMNESVLSLKLLINSAKTMEAQSFSDAEIAMPKAQTFATKDDQKTNELIRILREKSSAIARLELLVSTNLIGLLLGAPEIRAKLLNTNWMFDDSFKCQHLPPEEVAQFSYQLVNLVQKVKEFILSNKNKHLDGPKLEKCWNNIKESANSEGRIQWINSGGKAAPPSEAIAQWHFEALQKDSADGEQSDEEANEMFQKIIKGLNENRGHRKKLTQLLKLEGIKKLFNLHKINENKNSENAVTNSIEIRQQNEQKIAADKKENEMPQNETDNSAPKFEQKEEKEINLKKLATELAKINSFAAFCNDLILFEKYKEFILEPFEEKLKIVNIAAQVNEIEQRVKEIEKLFRFFQFNFGPMEFEKAKMGKSKMLWQIEIDQQIYEKINSKKESDKYLLPNFPKKSQQLTHFANIAEEMKFVENLENHLTKEAKSEDGNNSKERFDRKIKESLKKIHKIVDEWNANVRGLVKINYGTVFLIKFQFDGIEFDLTFVSIPSRKDLPVQINDESIKSFLDKFAIENSDDVKMLRVLSSYRSVRYVANLLSLDTANGDWTRILNDDAAGDGHQSVHQKSSKISKQFRNLLLSLKLWTKKNFIYSNRFGYFNGAMLTIMATKIMLLYPNASLPFLYEKFFLIYSTRPFDVPIQLKKLENASKLNLLPPINLTEAQMFVFTPSFPEQNAAKFVTYSTAKVIQKEIIGALNDIKSMGIGNYFDWALTNSTPFTEKFDYFILVNCAGEVQIGTDKFCQFVDGRIRLEFVYEIGIETRLYPNYFGQTCQIPKHFEAFNGKGIVTNYCKVWLAGVSLASAPDDLGESLSKMLNGFDLAIKRAYLRFNPTKDGVQNEGQMSESDEIQTIYRKLKFDLKSMLVERRRLID